MKEFLDKVREKYDNIIFDSPPLAVVTDSEILSRVIDGTVLVINSKKTTRGALNHSKQLLVKAKANVLGVVLNNLRVERGHYYYYSHYYYSKDSKDGAKRERKKKT
jgi:Mrp family chromosome partitioning ATPase